MAQCPKFILTFNMFYVIINIKSDNSQWGDLLTSYNGTAITYDAIGNPLSYYNGTAYTFTWEGRRLVGAVKGSSAMSFEYNDEGIRTSKTVNGVETVYYVNGSQIVAEKTGTRTIAYIYDASGTPIGMMYRTTSYAEGAFDVFWYEKNLQGDIIAVYNSAGTKVATYTYSDAWGNHTVSYSNGGASTGVVYNPFRYKSYYYDKDLGMYYLQSRYYDANICRFINADSALYHSMLGYNMFAYCNNNAVTSIDPAGNFSYTFLGDSDDDLDYWVLEGAGAGGYGATINYFGYGTSYYNYSVYSSTAAFDAYLGGYYYGGGGYIGGYAAQFAVGVVTVTDDMVTDSYKSRGSSGRTSPENLKEKLAMDQVKSNPLDGATKIPITMKDPRWPANEGWVKMSSNVNGVKIHFVYNTIINVFDDFKFVE